MASRAGPSSAKSPAAVSSPSLSSSSSAPARSAATDPVLRNALRYTISAREYGLLHKYVISRSRMLKKRAPTVDTVQKIMDGGSDSAAGRSRAQSLSSSSSSSAADKVKGKRKESDGNAVVGGGGADDYNARAIRHSIRVFVATGALMKLFGLVSARLVGGKAKHHEGAAANTTTPLHKSPTLRLSLSLSTILLMYRLLFRFLTRLRAHLLEPSAAPFRTRNPRTARTLTSPYAPAVGASLAGLALGVYPSQQLRVSVAVYTLFRALEFGWNCAEDNGMVWGWEKGVGGRPDRKKVRPWWWGSWMLQPFAFGQLLHAVVFDRDCFPTTYGDFIFKHSTTYLHAKPADYPSNVRWPKVYEIVDNLAQMARMNWPAFISPTLFPHKEDTLPTALSAIAPLTSGAHPLITSLSCATLHPTDPSCSRTFLTFWLRSFPPLTRFFLLVYSALLLPRFSALYHFPLSTLHKLVSSALRMAAFLTGSISTAWSSICFFQAWFPRTFLPTQRFFLGGFLAGFWALVERKRGRGVFLYSARVSVDSLWKVGVKRRWWRAMKGGDVWVFVLALMLTGVVYERDAKAVREKNWRKGISWVRGEGWKDWGVDEEEFEGEEGTEEL
ncbi:hypothetical protein B0T22DRAFT_432768 [Podospora appendiculata]|uniref:Transmembrane protein 135 N-terminal domain-containing protein n=1 Tax=Podospora appendiculata TaxID=314037 RepID=A0AAE0X0P9_9PEZI|nr:hypothetical protein B0T22DRAFT_432768 [Podospora appendiculata]